MKASLTILGIFILLGLGIVVVATSLGYFPALSSKIGIGQPKDLGVTYTDEDYASAQDKIESGDDGEVVKDTFTDAELTALLNSCLGLNCAIHDVQVKTYDDGTFEFSGVIDKDKLTEFVDTAHLSQDDRATIQTSLNILPSQPSFYAKAQLSGRDDTVSFSLSEATIAGFPVPDSLKEDIDAQIMSSLNAHLQSIPGTQIENIEVTPDGVFIEGSFE